MFRDMNGLRPHSASERSCTLKSPFTPLPVGFVSFARAGGSLTVAITVDRCCLLSITDHGRFTNRLIGLGSLMESEKLLDDGLQINEIPVFNPTPLVRQNSPPTRGPEFHQST